MRRKKKKDCHKLPKRNAGFKKNLQLCVQHDHRYASYTADKPLTESCDHSADIHHLVRSLYTNHICININIHELEIHTRGQSSSEMWHHERKLKITASMMKEVFHRKETTSCKSFLMKKLSCTAVTTAAMRYDIRHEQCAIDSYKNFYKLNGTEITVEPCGLFVDSSEPWLEASPDGIVFEGFQKGCLEVKCPFLCKQKSIADVRRENTSFCIEDKDGKLSLSNSHAYYYQIQMQMHVAKLPWCDFVVWSPVGDLFSVQRAIYVECYFKSTVFLFQHLFTCSCTLCHHC